jgi:IS30 family transposase
MSLRAIVKDLGRSPSTISREVSRNRGVIKYRAVIADEQAWERARRPKDCLLATRTKLCQTVASKLAMKWSPEQVSGWLKREFPDELDMQISHETIYRSLFIQARGVLKKELVLHLRSRRMMRRSKLSTTKGRPRGRISMQYQSANALQKLQTELSRGIGKAIFLLALTTVTLPR